MCMRTLMVGPVSASFLILLLQENVSIYQKELVMLTYSYSARVRMSELSYVPLETTQKLKPIQALIVCIVRRLYYIFCDFLHFERTHVYSTSLPRLCHGKYLS